MNYYYLYSREKSSVEVDEPWISTELVGKYCPKCFNLYPNPSIPQIKLKHRAMKTSLNFINLITGLYTISEDFYKAVGKENITENFDTKPLLSCKGDVLEFPFVIKGKKQIIIRGDEKSQFRICSKCGNYLYFPCGKWYLVKNEIENIKICQAQIGLVVCQEIYERLKITKQIKLGILKLPLVDKPIDNIFIGEQNIDKF